MDGWFGAKQRSANSCETRAIRTGGPAMWWITLPLSRGTGATVQQICSGRPLRKRRPRTSGNEVDPTQNDKTECSPTGSVRAPHCPTSLAPSNRSGAARGGTTPTQAHLLAIRVVNEGIKLLCMHHGSPRADSLYVKGGLGAADGS